MSMRGTPGYRCRCPRPMPMSRTDHCGWCGGILQQPPEAVPLSATDVMHDIVTRQALARADQDESKIRLQLVNEVAEALIASPLLRGQPLQLHIDAAGIAVDAFAAFISRAQTQAATGATLYMRDGNKTWIDAVRGASDE